MFGDTIRGGGIKMYSIKTEVVERLELESIRINKPIRLYTIDEMIIHDNLLTEIKANVSREIKKINEEITELESARGYLQIELERLEDNKVILKNGIVECVIAERVKRE
jgi:hypothetical protein